MSNETLGSPERLQEVHRSQGIVPLVNDSQDELLDLSQVKLHQKNLKELQRLLILVENPQDITHFTAQKLLAQLSYGFRKAGEYAALAMFEYKEARAERKSAEAIAFLDNFRDYVKEQKVAGNDVKVTDEGKKHYVNIDPAVRAASRKEALFEAMFEQTRTIKMEFMMAISTVKSIAYGYKDKDAISSASLSGSTEE